MRGTGVHAPWKVDKHRRMECRRFTPVRSAAAYSKKRHLGEREPTTERVPKMITARVIARASGINGWYIGELLARAGHHAKHISKAIADR